MKLVNPAVSLFLLSLVLSNCASPYYSSTARLDWDEVLVWGRITAISNGRLNYDCRVNVGGRSAPLDARGLFAIKVPPTTTGLASLTCSNGAVKLPDNFAQIRNDLGPRSVYLGNISIKFRDYSRGNSHTYQARAIDYFDVKDSYFEDHALLVTRMNSFIALRPSKSLLKTSGANETSWDRAPASVGTLRPYAAPPSVNDFQYNDYLDD